MKYIYENDLFDVLTFGDIFNVDYKKINCTQGSDILKYYLFNMKTHKIDNHKNGLISI